MPACRQAGAVRCASGPTGRRPGGSRPTSVACCLLLVAGCLGFLLATSNWRLATVYAIQPHTEALDTNEDGKIDEWRTYEGERLLEVQRDRDGDGRPEVWIYFEEGKPVRSEVDRNGDGTTDLIRFMKEGRPEREEGDLNFDGRPDAWIFYKDGFKDLMIMDKNHDGQPDAWFYYGQGGWKLVGGRVDEDFDGTLDRTFGSVPEEEERQPW